MQKTRRFRSVRRLVPAALVCAALVGQVIVPASARSELKPMLREMLENLAAMNDIGAGVSLTDYDRIERAARTLEVNARALRSITMADIGVDAGDASAFDSFLRTQEELAKAIRSAAGTRDEQEIMLAYQRMMNEACLSCHKAFRERHNLLRPSVAIMTSLLFAWQEINRGMLINDFGLVEENAAQIRSTVRIFTNDAMIAPVFGVQKPEQRAEFRRLLRKVESRARQIEEAAAKEQSAAVTSATHQMWVEGCISCHRAFR